MPGKDEHLEAELRALQAQLAAVQLAHDQLHSLSSQPDQAEASLLTIIDAIPGLIAYVDQAHRYRFVNATYEAWFGVSRAEILNRTIAELVEPDIYEQVRPYIERALAGERVTFENELVYPITNQKVVQATYEPHRTPDGQVVGFYVLVIDITDRKRAELAAHLLAEVGKVLTSSLDYALRLSSLAELVVPQLADWCVVSLIEGTTVRNVAVAHIDPAKVVLARELQHRYPPRPDELSRQLMPWQRGQSDFYPEITPAMLEIAARDAEHYQILQDLQFNSAMTVPLVARDRVLGMMLFVWAESGKRYEARDLALAEELAQRAALAIDNAYAYEAQQQARAAAERASNQLHLLAAASEILMTSLDYESTLADLTRLMVPALADWCVIDVIGQDGQIHRLAVVHQDPNKTDLADQLKTRYPAINPTGYHTVAKTLRHGQPWFDAAVSPVRLAAEARDVTHLELLQALGFASEMVMPLVARGRTLGALTFVRSEVERGYQAADLTLAEELAGRVALSVDNARLYREAQSLNSELEARVAERTAALQTTNHQLENEIAEHRRTQTELAELRRRQLDGREAERLFLAQELHDGPVQELYGVAYRLEQLAQPDLNEVNQMLLAKTQERVQKVMVSLRAMASDLRPPTLAEFGLERTILSHIDQFQPSYPHIQIEHDLQPDGTSLPENVRLALFRIYQAALNNVIRHANATRVVIQFRFDSDKIYLTVEDNGRGFVLPRHWIDLARQGHLGLVGMVERAEAIGGQTTVRSSPDQGALIQVVVPRHPPA